MSTESRLPVKTFRLGRIKAAVWENEADRKKFYNVTFTRTCVGEARNYHDTDSSLGHWASVEVEDRRRL